MKIILYGINYAPELTGIGKYSAEMAEWLAAQSHEVRIVCAPPYYPQWQIAAGYRRFSYQKEMIKGIAVYRCPLYVPKQPKILSRLLHLLSFSLSSLPVVLSQWRWRPDLVLTVEPTFFCTPVTLLLAKLTGAKSVLHIQDYELDAMLGLGMGKTGKLAVLAHSVERFVMRRFSAVSSISISMLERAAVKLNRSVSDTAKAVIPRLILFPNWVDIDFVTPFANADVFRQKWQIAESSKVVLYSGNMGKKQGLALVLEAADCFKQQDTVFIFVGTGAAVCDLKQKADALNLRNTRFFPLQPYQGLPNLMALADVHLVVQKKGVADAVLPSKLTTILSAGGRALITAEDNTELGVLCADYPGIAKLVAPENLTLFCDGLQLLLDQVDTEHRTFNQIARGYAIDHLAKDAVLKKFEGELLDLVKS